MFIYNVKINGSKTFKTFFIGIILLVIIVLGIVSIKIFKGASHASPNSSCFPKNQITELSTSNYTNILKAVHDDVDSYIGIKIKFTGYIYRVLDLQENQFILARNMMISPDFQSVVVGFLCECNNAKDFENDTWVELTRRNYQRKLSWNHANYQSY